MCSFSECAHWPNKQCPLSLPLPHFHLALSSLWHLCCTSGLVPAGLSLPRKPAQLLKELLWVVLYWPSLWGKHRHCVLELLCLHCPSHLPPSAAWQGLVACKSSCWWHWRPGSKAGWMIISLDSTHLRVMTFWRLEKLSFISSWHLYGFKYSVFRVSDLPKARYQKIWLNSGSGSHLYTSVLFPVFCCTTSLLPCLVLEISRFPPPDFAFCFPSMLSLKLAFLSFLPKPSCSPLLLVWSLFLTMCNLQCIIWWETVISPGQGCVLSQTHSCLFYCMRLNKKDRNRRVHRHSQINCVLWPVFQITLVECIYLKIQGLMLENNVPLLIYS